MLESLAKGIYMGGIRFNIALCLKYRSVIDTVFLFQELKSLEPQENFRLWLTAESHPKFPTILLQSSLKITYEVSCSK